MAEIKYIPVSKLWRHPDNPRKDLGDVTELAESIKVNGVLQNLTVVPLIGEITKKWDGESYRVIIGHRRLAAAKLAGLEELPCVVVEMSEREQLSTMLTENMQRSDLTVYEQAQGFQMMLDMCSCGGLRIMTEAEFPNAPPVGICRTVWSGASSAVKDFCPMRSQRSGASRRRKYAWIVPPAAGRIRWSAPEHAATDTFTVDAQPAVVW